MSALHRRHFLLGCATSLALAAGATPALADDPLPSWNDGAAKQAIIEFVKVTTDTASPKFVPPEARIVTFDQDGTTWVEQPIYTQVMYCLDRVRPLVWVDRFGSEAGVSTTTAASPLCP